MLLNPADKLYINIKQNVMALCRRDATVYHRDRTPESPLTHKMPGREIVPSPGLIQNSRIKPSSINA